MTGADGGNSSNRLTWYAAGNGLLSLIIKSVWHKEAVHDDLHSPGHGGRVKI